MPHFPAPLKLEFQTLSWAFPARTEQLAAWLFCHPMRGKAPPDERAVSFLS